MYKASVFTFGVKSFFERIALSFDLGVDECRVHELQKADHCLWCISFLVQVESPLEVEEFEHDCSESVHVEVVLLLVLVDLPNQGLDLEEELVLKV